MKLENCLRQGDNIAMNLFIINIEPLFVKLERYIKGIRVGKVDQKGEGYVDDFSYISSETNDLIVVDRIFREFEELSGTLLHRSKKCKIIGLGKWAGRESWPLPWLQTVDRIKIFEIFVTIHQTQ